jgi:hypothetical protein
MMTGDSCYEKARNLRMCRLIRSMASIDKSRVIGGELSMRNRKKGIWISVRKAEAYLSLATEGISRWFPR